MPVAQAANRWIVLSILSSALFLITIDVTVLYTALPRLTAELGASASEKLWIVNAYPLVMAGLLLGAGTLGDRVGHRRLFLVGLVIFGMASLVAAFAPNPAVLIAARALLAVGAAGMMPATLSLIRLIFDDAHERSVAIGIWAAVASGGAAFGPVLGGALLEYFWWGSVFLINVPVVVVALLATIWVIPSVPGNRSKPWDAVGSAQILVGLVALTYAVKELAKQAPSWSALVVSALIGLVALALFKRRQDKRAHKLIDFTLFRDRQFASGVVAAMVTMLALVGLQLVLSQRLQLVLDLTPLQAGLTLLPIPLGAFLAGPIAGLVAARLGTINVLWIGLLLASAGLILSLLVQDASQFSQIGSFFLLGFGLGAAMTAASTVIMANVPAEQAGMAASIEEVSFELGGAIGIAVLGSALAAVYGMSIALPRQAGIPAEVFDGLDQALVSAATVPPEMGQTIRNAARAAFDLGFLSVMIFVAVVLVLSSVSVWFVCRSPSLEARD
ncbi:MULTISPECIES: MFS transporter [unclassified Rhizobium]|uniref:MFS transporter n=1 Tax=unclassified Rhizobium TaxID=2613769 RepID=UPI0017875348|nr:MULTISPECIES: MFS transporter [unclassified Rhizobium]MBD8687156.1 MFS transporter [Rhizobium sp. CFBP 13644]MBD8691041.1 MFS transporter [Rhizobium sp. CFBP 13717]